MNDEQFKNKVYDLADKKIKRRKRAAAGLRAAALSAAAVAVLAVGLTVFANSFAHDAMTANYSPEAVGGAGDAAPLDEAQNAASEQTVLLVERGGVCKRIQGDAELHALVSALAFVPDAADPESAPDESGGDKAEAAETVFVFTGGHAYDFYGDVFLSDGSARNVITYGKEELYEHIDELFASPGNEIDKAEMEALLSVYGSRRNG